jgi:DNA-binding response OmpR family regulator
MRFGVLHKDSTRSARWAKALKDAGHQPVVFADGDLLTAAAKKAGFDLLLMQWDGAPIGGVALMHRLRARLTPAPAMFILVDGRAPPFIAETADIELPDPCPIGALKEAVERLAVSRGLNGRRHDPASHLQFDDGSAVVRVHGLPVQLTAKEFALAQMLVRNAGTPLSRAQIMSSVWGRAQDPGSRTLDAHVAQVRKRLLLRPDQGWRLSSVYGFGYRLDRVDDSVTGRAASATP